MLRIENLCVAREGIRVLLDVSLLVEEGRIVSLLGANCAGKSTLINTISGLIKPTSGKMEFEGIDLKKLKPHEIVKKGVVQVPEGRKLFSRMTVLENLKLASFAVNDEGGSKRAMEEVFHLFPVLKERRNQLAETLSGGEQQMTAIGRSLMLQPKLLMLDEPSLGLAPLLVNEIFKIVQNLRDLGKTILLVEQNVRHSIRICDYAYILGNGRIVLEGKGEALVQNELIKEPYLGI